MENIKIILKCTRCGGKKVLEIKGKRWLVKRFFRKFGNVHPCSVNHCDGDLVIAEEYHY